ncbi:MAG: helix-turn-helix domain-containing protein [Terracidiphilus sp.]
MQALRTEGKSIREIATSVGASPTTVQKLLKPAA